MVWMKRMGESIRGEVCLERGASGGIEVPLRMFFFLLHRYPYQID